MCAVSPPPKPPPAVANNPAVDDVRVELPPATPGGSLLTANACPPKPTEISKYPFSGISAG